MSPGRWCPRIARPVLRYAGYTWAATGPAPFRPGCRAPVNVALSLLVNAGCCPERLRWSGLAYVARSFLLWWSVHVGGGRKRAPERARSVVPPSRRWRRWLTSSRWLGHQSRRSPPACQRQGRSRLCGRRSSGTRPVAAVARGRGLLIVARAGRRAGPPLIGVAPPPRTVCPGGRGDAHSCQLRPEVAVQFVWIC
jgi:hypothetical protein